MSRHYIRCAEDPDCSNYIYVKNNEDDESSESEPDSNSSILLSSKVRGQKKLTAGDYNVKSDPKYGHQSNRVTVHICVLSCLS